MAQATASRRSATDMQGAGMAVSAPAKCGVLRLADGILLDRDPCPVTNCIAPAGVGGHGGVRRVCTCRTAV